MAIKLNLDAIGFNPEKSRQRGQVFDVVLVPPFKVDEEKKVLTGILFNPPQALAHLEGKPIRVMIRNHEKTSTLETADYRGDCIDGRLQRVIAQRNVDAIVVEHALFYPESTRVMAHWLTLATQERVLTGPISVSGVQSEKNVIHGIQVWDNHIIFEDDEDRIDMLKAVLDDSAQAYWESLKCYKEQGEKTPYQPTVGFAIFVHDRQTGKVVRFVPAQINHMSAVYNATANEIEDESQRVDWRFSPPSAEDLESFMTALHERYPETRLSVAFFRNFRPSKKSESVFFAAQRLLQKKVPIGFDEDGTVLFTLRDPAMACVYGVALTGKEEHKGWISSLQTHAKKMWLPKVFGLEVDERLESVASEYLEFKDEELSSS